MNRDHPLRLTVKHLQTLCFKGLLWGSIIACCACCGRTSPTSGTGHESRTASGFTVPDPPVMLNDAQKADYVRTHFWDRFDFSDTAFLHQFTRTQLTLLFARYISLFSSDPFNRTPIDSLMRKASVSRRMMDEFVRMAEEVLYDPNSPLRNDELYIPVLEAQLNSPYYDQTERSRPLFRLHLVSQNRIGKQANDFRYTVADGSTHSLYQIRSEFVLLFINTPGCPLCEDVRKQLVAADWLTDGVEQGRITVLGLYPDEDEALWKQHLQDFPARWINGRDPDGQIQRDGSYKVNAIPALYLLDRNKIVLVKDATDIRLIEQAVKLRSPER